MTTAAPVAAEAAVKLTQTEVDLRRLSAQIPSGSMVLTTKGQAVIE